MLENFLSNLIKDLITNVVEDSKESSKVANLILSESEPSENENFSESELDEINDELTDKTHVLYDNRMLTGIDEEILNMAKDYPGILPPDHPLMNKFQETIQKKLNETLNAIKLDNIKIEKEIKLVEEEKKTTTLKLYNQQKQLEHLKNKAVLISEEEIVLDKINSSKFNIKENLEKDINLVNEGIQEEQKLLLTAVKKRRENEIEIIQIRNLKKAIEDDKKLAKTMLDKTKKDLIGIALQKDDQDAQMEQLAWTIDQKESEFKQLSVDLKLLDNDIHQNQSKFDSLESKFIERIAMTKMAEKKLDDVYREIENRNIASFEADKELEMLINKQNVLKVEESKLKKELEHEKDISGDVRIKHTNINEQYDETNQNISDLEKEHIQIQKELEKTEENYRQSEKIMNSHKSELKSKRNEVLKLEKEVEKKIIDLQQAEKTLLLKQLDSNLANKEASNLKKSADLLIKDNLEATIRTNKLESELSKVKNEEVECDQDLINLEEQQKEYEQKLRSGIAFHKNVENQLSASNTEIERIQKRIEQMNEKIAAVRARNGGIDASPFEIELNSLKKSCQEKYEEQKQLERRWLQTRQQTVEEKQHFTAIKERLEELSDRLVIRKNEEFKAKKSLEDITNHRRVLEKETEKLNKDLENMELMVNKEKQKVETNGMNVEKNEERLDSMIQVMQEQVYKLEQKIEENRYRAENLARKNYECDISIGNWCQKLEILNEIRDTVSSEKVKKEFEDLKLTIHNLEGEEERIKREQEKILSSLEKIANYQSENIFSISARRSSDISFNFDSLQESNAQQHFKSLKAASRANLHIKYSEQQRKLRKSITELEKIEEQVLSLEDNRKSLQQKATDISNEIDNSITRSKELESKTIQLDIEKLLMSIKLAVEQQKKKKTDLLVNKSEENQSIIAEDTLNRLEEEKSNLTEQMHDVIVGKNASFAPLLTSRYSLAVVNYIKEFADIQDIGK